jgi:hypothetical protein
VEIAKYTVGVDFNLKWKQLDKNLKLLEKKLAKFSAGKLAFSIDRFVVDQRKLNIVLGNALDRASMTTAFSIDRFVIDQASLTRQMTRAMKNAARAASSQADITPNVNGRGGISTRQAGVAGGVGGFTARAYMPLVALAGGGYGLGALNRRNQEIVSAQLQTSAIVQQAGGNAAQGTEAFDWLRAQGERVGFNWLEAIPDYNKLISGLTGAGMTVGQSQGVFQGFSELARVNKLDRTSQNRLFRALSQVAGKNQLMSEELTGQIAEALPGGIAVFAEAYQRKLAAEGRGGGKTGSEAIQELRSAMERREVKGDILLYAGQRAGEMAQPGLTAAQKASQAEQARFQNAYNQLAMVASNAGVESGFARLFRAMADGAREAGPLVESLAKGFDEITKYVSVAMLSFQSLQRFFQGRDSFLGDKLFPDKETRSKALLWLESTKQAFTEVNTLLGNSITGWQQLLGTLESSSVLDRLMTAMSTISNSAGALNALVEGDFGKAGEMAAEAGKRYANTLTAPGRAGVNAALRGGTRLLEAIDPRVDVGSTVPPQLSGFSVTEDWITQQKIQRQLAAQQAAKEGYQNPVGIFPMDKQAGQVTATFNIYDATNPDKVGEVVRIKLEDMFKAVNAENPELE